MQHDCPQDLPFTRGGDNFCLTCSKCLVARRNAISSDAACTLYCSTSLCSLLTCTCPAETQHSFTMKENDWGFNQFVHQRSLTPAEGFVVNDTLVIDVYIRLNSFESFNYNSKKETGHVGLKNQGATCYMNSLLQTLYNLNHFRKVHYCLDIPLCPQAIFCSRKQYANFSWLFCLLIDSSTLLPSCKMSILLSWGKHDSALQA